MATLFISDLHLDSRRPEITALFLEFLERRAVTAEALYILGDLFEVWIGDDNDEPLGKEVATALKALSQRGVPIYFIHGNRDFLLGEGFASASGVKLLPEAVVIDLYATPTLIMHGDMLCTDDVDYQAFRARVRSAEWQTHILSLPLAQRQVIGKQLRAESEQALKGKANDITDVNFDAVINAMRTHSVQQLIHGHTHRPNVHQWEINGEKFQRIVLGDWYVQGSVLYCDETGQRLEKLPLIMSPTLHNNQ